MKRIYHRITNIDEANKTGNCCICGQVELYKASVKNNKQYYRCKNYANEFDKYAPDGKKYCVRCSEYKTIDEYPISNNTDDGRTGVCKFCSKKRYYKHSYDYDLTKEVYENKTNCDICNNKFKEKGEPHLDHCHKTNEVRGWLCHNCNRMLGAAKDNPDTLLKAVDYLGVSSSGLSSV